MKFESLINPSKVSTFKKESPKLGLKYKKVKKYNEKPRLDLENGDTDPSSGRRRISTKPEALDDPGREVDAVAEGLAPPTNENLHRTFSDSLFGRKVGQQDGLDPQLQRGSGVPGQSRRQNQRRHFHIFQKNFTNVKFSQFWRLKVFRFSIF